MGFAESQKTAAIRKGGTPWEGPSLPLFSWLFVWKDGFPEKGLLATGGNRLPFYEQGGDLLGRNVPSTFLLASACCSQKKRASPGVGLLFHFSTGCGEPQPAYKCLPFKCFFFLLSVKICRELITGSPLKFCSFLLPKAFPGSRMQRHLNPCFLIPLDRLQRSERSSGLNGSAGLHEGSCMKTG